MHRILRFGVVVAIASQLTVHAASAGVGESKTFKGPTGLQLYSLRGMQKEQGVNAVLDIAREWGFKYVEVSALGNLTPTQFRAELDKRGLVPIGKHFPFQQLRDDIDGVIAEAKGLGLPNVGCAWIAHKKPFDEKQCLAAARGLQSRR